MTKPSIYVIAGAFETTLSARHFATFLKKQKNKGYQVHLLYLWLPSPNFAYKRVQFRVKAGGHAIPKEIIERRYYRGLSNLFKIYMPLVTSCHIFNNSGSEPRLIALHFNGKTIVEDHMIWEVLKRKYE